MLHLMTDEHFLHTEVTIDDFIDGMAAFQANNPEEVNGESGTLGFNLFSDNPQKFQEIRELANTLQFDEMFEAITQYVLDQHYVMDVNDG